MDFWTYRPMFMLIILCHNAHVDCIVRLNGKRVSVRHVRLPVTTFCSCCGCDEYGIARSSIVLQNGICVFEVNQNENCNSCAKKGGLWEEILASRKLVWACFDRVLLCFFKNRFVGIDEILETHRELHCSWMIYIFSIVSVITVKGLLDRQVLLVHNWKSVHWKRVNNHCFSNWRELQGKACTTQKARRANLST